MKLTDFLKDDRIVVPELNVKRRLIPQDMAKRFDAVKELDAASIKQERLGLGVPRVDLNPKLDKVRKETYQYNKSRLLKAGYKMVINPPEEFFPRFNDKGQTTKTFLKNPPTLAMVHLSKGLQNITCSVNGKGGREEFNAPIPRFPAKAVDEVEKVKALAPDSEFHLLYMPSWSAVPQRDPVLLAKTGGKFFYVYGWLGDKAIIDTILGA